MLSRNALKSIGFSREGYEKVDEKRRGVALAEHWAYLAVETQDMCLAACQDIRLAATPDMCCVESYDMLRHVFRSEPIQRNHKGARQPKAASFVLALSEAHVQALNTAQVLRLQQGRCLGSQLRTCLASQK